MHMRRAILSDITVGLSSVVRLCMRRKSSSLSLMLHLKGQLYCSDTEKYGQVTRDKEKKNKEKSSGRAEARWTGNGSCTVEGGLAVGFGSCCSLKAASVEMDRRRSVSEA